MNNRIIEEARKYFIGQRGIATLSAGFITFIGLLSALSGIYKDWFVGDNRGAVLWAFTVALTLYVFGLLLSYCFLAQTVLRDEIDRVSKAKSDLESLVLSKRQSSRKRKK